MPSSPWIPAFAGMTDVETPAFAGMFNKGMRAWVGMTIKRGPDRRDTPFDGRNTSDNEQNE